jgi:hypothetical protein
MPYAKVSAHDRAIRGSIDWQFDVAELARGAHRIKGRIPSGPWEAQICGATADVFNLTVGQPYPVPSAPEETGSPGQIASHKLIEQGTLKLGEITASELQRPGLAHFCCGIRT